MEEKKPRHKGFYILPNLITTASLFSGFLAIVFAADGRFEDSALAILVGAVLDGLDGKVARITGTSSAFGIQYDSLADLVAFGVAPGFMVYCWNLHSFGRLGLAAAFLFVTCGALRLARFNIITATTPKRYSIGFTITASGCLLATWVFFTPLLPDLFADILPAITLGLTLALAFLMVSRVLYNSFKEYGFITAHPYRSMVTAILGFVLILTAPRFFCFILFAGFALSGPVDTYILIPRRKKKAAPAEGN